MADPPRYSLRATLKMPARLGAPDAAVGSIIVERRRAVSVDHNDAKTARVKRPYKRRAAPPSPSPPPSDEDEDAATADAPADEIKFTAPVLTSSSSSSSSSSTDTPAQPSGSVLAFPAGPMPIINLMSPHHRGVDVVMFTNQIVRVTCNEQTDNIAYIKRSVQHIAQVPVVEQMLVLNGRELEDDRLLSSYGITNASRINLLLRPGRMYLYIQFIPAIPLVEPMRSVAILYASMYAPVSDVHDTIGEAYSMSAEEIDLQTAAGYTLPRWRNLPSCGVTDGSTLFLRRRACAALQNPAEGRAAPQTPAGPPLRG